MELDARQQRVIDALNEVGGERRWTFDRPDGGRVEWWSIIHDESGEEIRIIEFDTDGEFRIYRPFPDLDTDAETIRAGLAPDRPEPQTVNVPAEAAGEPPDEPEGRQGDSDVQAAFLATVEARGSTLDRSGAWSDGRIEILATQRGGSILVVMEDTGGVSAWTYVGSIVGVATPEAIETLAGRLIDGGTDAARQISLESKSSDDSLPNCANRITILASVMDSVATAVERGREALSGAGMAFKDRDSVIELKTVVDQVMRATLNEARAAIDAAEGSNNGDNPTW